MRRILLAYDGSDSSKRALQYVIDFARIHAAKLEVNLINVQHEPLLYGEYVTSEFVEQLQQSLLSAAAQALEWPAAQLQDAGIEHKSHPALGNVAEQVKEAVEQLKCDTVVMGTRGLGTFTGLLLGSVATRVIHEVPVPVLLVK